MNHGVVGEDAVDGVAENENRQGQQFGNHQCDADGRPDTAIDLIQLPGANHVAQQNLGGLRHGDGVHIGYIGQHTAVDLGGYHRRAHEIDKAEDKRLGNVVGQGFRAGWQGNAQQSAEGFRGKRPQIPQGKAEGAFALQGDAGQNQPHGLGDDGGHGGACHPHLGEAQQAVDEDGVAHDVQQIHGNGEHHHLFQQGVTPQHGAQLDVKPLQQHGAAYNAGVEAGAVKGLLRRLQQLENQLWLQQQEKPHQKAEHGADRYRRRDDFVALFPGAAGADVLGQQDGGGGAHGGQHNDDHIHHLIAVADGGHGSGAEAGNHELIHVAHQQLQQKFRENGQRQVKDPAGLGRKVERHESELLNHE